MARVLVVDDEEAIRKIVGIYAANDGHTVAVACDTSEARDLLQREAFDIVVSDIVLPRQSGVVLLAHIRETQPDIQVRLEKIGQRCEMTPAPQIWQTQPHFDDLSPHRFLQSNSLILA